MSVLSNVCPAGKLLLCKNTLRRERTKAYFCYYGINVPVWQLFFTDGIYKRKYEPFLSWRKKI